MSVLVLAVSVLVFIFIILVISVFIGVPFLPTNRRQAERMIALAALRPGMQVVDLGSGAGRLLFLAAATGARATGYELNPFLYLWTKLMIALRGAGGRVSVRLQSLYTADLSDADAVFAFLLNQPMRRLEQKLFSELKPGAKIISYVFPIPGRAPLVKEQGIYVYEVPGGAVD